MDNLEYKADKELQGVAECWAEKVYHHMCICVTEPTEKLTEEESRLYIELKYWGWFDMFPLNDDDAETATRKHLAMRQYSKLKWHKDHPPKPKKSKWEIVTGHRDKNKDK